MISYSDGAKVWWKSAVTVSRQLFDRFLVGIITLIPKSFLTVVGLRVSLTLDKVSLMAELLRLVHSNQSVTLHELMSCARSRICTSTTYEIARTARDHPEAL